MNETGCTEQVLKNAKNLNDMFPGNLKEKIYFVKDCDTNDLNSLVSLYLDGLSNPGKRRPEMEKQKFPKWPNYPPIKRTVLESLGINVYTSIPLLKARLWVKDRLKKQNKIERRKVLIVHTHAITKMKDWCPYSWLHHLDEKIEKISETKQLIFYIMFLPCCVSLFFSAYIFPSCVYWNSL